MTTETVYLSDRAVARRYDVSRATIWRWTNTDPAFPKPIKLGPSITRWRLDELVHWEAGRAAA